MNKPIVGIRLKDSTFVPLIDKENKKTVYVCKSDFVNRQIPVYVCRLSEKAEIEKIYKIGSVELNQEHYESLKENTDDSDNSKKFAKLDATCSDDGIFELEVSLGIKTDYIHVKSYEADIYKEINEQEFAEREEALLDYGDFIKRKVTTAILLPEDDVKNILTEKESVESKSSSDRDEYYELAQKVKIKKPVRRKFIKFAVFAFLFAAAATIYFVFTLFRDSANIEAQTRNSDKNTYAAAKIDSEISSIIERSEFFYRLYLAQSNNELKNKIRDSFFAGEKTIAAVLTQDDLLKNDKLIYSSGIKEDTLDSLFSTYKADVENAGKGNKSIRNISHIVKSCSALIFYPVKSTGAKYDVLGIVINSDHLAALCNENGNENLTFLVDDKGNIIAGLDFSVVLSSQNMCDYSIVNNFVNDKSSKMQTSFSKDEEKYYGAFKSLMSGSCAVITVNPASKIDLKKSKYVLSTLCFLALAELFIVIIFAWITSLKITIPAKALISATDRVSAGDYNVKLKSHSKDELGTLVTKFSMMCQSLLKHENIKMSFGKFGDERISQIAMNGKVSLGGETKFVTTLFVSIKNFLDITDKLTATEVVELLSKYMDVVFKCVSENKGCIDKVIGDEVVVIWGSPLTSGTPKQDAIDSVKCACAMKQKIESVSRELRRENKPAIKLACGIHSGPVVAGQIGSSDRKEYTCIGRTLKQTADIKGRALLSDKDILITQDTLNLVQDVCAAEKVAYDESSDASLNDYAVIRMTGDR